MFAHFTFMPSVHPRVAKRFFSGGTDDSDRSWQCFQFCDSPNRSGHDHETSRIWQPGEGLCPPKRTTDDDAVELREGSLIMHIQSERNGNALFMCLHIMRSADFLGESENRRTVRRSCLPRTVPNCWNTFFFHHTGKRKLNMLFVFHCGDGVLGP